MFSHVERNEGKSHFIFTLTSTCQQMVTLCHFGLVISTVLELKIKMRCWMSYYIDNTPFLYVCL